MDYFKLFNLQDNIEHSNISSECLSCFQSCPAGISISNSLHCGQKRKRYLEENENGIVYFCSDDQSCINSNKILKSKVQIIKSLVPLLNSYKTQISQDLNRQNKRIFHNIVSLNAHNIQELYALVSDKILSQKVEQQRVIIKKSIENNIDEAVSMFLRIAKNNLAIQTNFNVFNKLSEPNPIMNYRKQKIRKVLLAVYHVFFQDFFEKEIRVIIDECESEFPIDFESVSIAFYHILDNASKYALGSSRLYIKFLDKDTTCSILFEMDSIEIKDYERDKLTNEGFKGEMANKMQSEGNGIGMFIVNQLLTLTKSRLIILTKINSQKQLFHGIPYYRNQFIIELSKLNKGRNY